MYFLRNSLCVSVMAIVIQIKTIIFTAKVRIHDAKRERERERERAKDESPSRNKIFPNINYLQFTPTEAVRIHDTITMIVNATVQIKHVF